MPLTSAGVFGADTARSRLARFACVVLIAVGWAGLAVMCREALGRTPPAAGFDLQVLLDAGRRVAEGASPYDSNAVKAGLTARDLFYSYPPLVAQALAPLSGAPGWAVLGAWWVGAVGGLAVVAAALARPGMRSDVALVALAAAPLFLPFAVGLIFGNVDMWFPLLFGALLVAVLRGAAGGATSRPAAALGGVALAVASAVKIHPASLLVWLAVRAVRVGGERRGLALTAGSAALFGLAILAASLLVGGIGPWQQYPEYLRLGSNADLASRVNIGPASQIALLLGDSSVARPIALVVGAVAVIATAAAAWLVRDPLESFAWAIAASMVALPVTWYHYPVALIPVAIALWVRTRGTPGAGRVTRAILTAYVVADLAVVLPVVQWIAVSILLAAVRWDARQIPAGVADPLATQAPV